MNPHRTPARPWLGSLLGAALLAACGGSDAPPAATLVAVAAPAADSRAARLDLAGVDANRNGVRDDIDAALARLAADQPRLHSAALNLARSEQALLVHGSAAARTAYIAALQCGGVPASLADALTTALLNTPAHATRQAQVLAGATLSAQACGGRPAKAAAAPAQPVIYINNAAVTLARAHENLLALDAVLQASRNHSAEPQTFALTLVYNPIGWSGQTLGDTARHEDAQEIFLLKTAEEHYAADMAQLVLPHDARSANLDTAAAARVKAHLDDMTPGGNSLESSGAVTDAQMAATQAATRALSAHMAAQPGSIVVAHGEGNLLANLAWADRVSQVGNAIATEARIVHVGNAASVAVNRLDLTHAGDRDINQTLPQLAIPRPKKGWAGATRTTPVRDGGYCAFSHAEPTFAAAKRAGPNSQWAGFYLSETPLPTVNQPWGVTYTVGAVAARDRLEDLVYAAVASLQRAQQPPEPTGRLPHSGIQPSQCYGSGGFVLVDCASPEAQALNSQQDGMRAHINPMSYSLVPKANGAFYDKTECVTDNVTGLMWEGKTATGLRAGMNLYTNLGDGRSGDASAYAAAINASGLCGHSDWRLPTVDELQGLVDYGVPFPGPTIDANWFPNTEGWTYWTASLSAVDPEYDAWIVFFYNGKIYEYPRDYGLSVRLVRASQ